VIIYKKSGSLGKGDTISVPCTSNSETISNLEGTTEYQFQVAIRSETKLEIYTGPTVTVLVLLMNVRIFTTKPVPVTRDGNFSGAGGIYIISGGAG
jgi:hypothetical protein